VGPASDRLGRRGIALFTLGLFLLGGLVTLFAPNIATLVAGRVIQGVGASGGVVLARSMLRDSFSKIAAARAAATMSMWIAVVPMLAPLVGGYVQHAFGWRANMLLVTLLGLALLLISHRQLSETHPEERRHAHHGVGFAHGYFQLLRLPSFIAHSVPVALGATATFAYQTAAPVLLIGRLHLSAFEYGFFGAMPAAGFVIGSSCTRRVAARVSGAQLMRVGGFICMGAGATISLLALGWPPRALFVALPMVVFGIGNGLLLPSGSVGSMSAAPGLIGASAALSSCMRMAAGACGSLIAATLPNGSAFGLGCVVLLASAAGGLWWRLLGRDLAG
jgi:DHA1 family bicyclomycin/chloramphenicol resistance-like MFS transporter